MFFTCLEGGFEPVALEEAAALLAVNQPAARAWLIALSNTDGALLCLGQENNSVKALAAGVIQRAAQGKVFLLQEMCVAPVRRRCGVGVELLTFALQAAEGRGAGVVIAVERLAALGDEFLRKQGFTPAPCGARLSRRLGREAR